MWKLCRHWEELTNQNIIFSVDLQDVTDEDRYFFSNDVTLQLSWRANPHTTVTRSSEEPRVMRQHKTDWTKVNVGRSRIRVHKSEYRIYSHNLRTSFPSLAAEKSGCVKYADFFFVEVLIWCVKWSVHTRIVEKQLKYLRYITVQSCSQLPQEQQPLMFKDKQQCWSTVFRISLW
jgi:hypothetical protein